MISNLRVHAHIRQLFGFNIKLCIFLRGFIFRGGMLEYVIFQNITSFVFLIFIIWIATFHLKTASFYLNNPLWASLHQNMLRSVLCEFNVNKVWNLLSYVLIMILTAGLYVILWCVIFPNHFPTASWSIDLQAYFIKSCLYMK